MVIRSLYGDVSSYMKNKLTMVNFFATKTRSLRNTVVNLKLPLLKSAWGGNGSGTEEPNFGIVMALKSEILQP